MGTASLENHGLSEDCKILNETIGSITRNYAGENAFIAGTITSSQMTLVPYGDESFTDITAIYDRQVKSLEPYVNMFLLINMVSLWDMRAAVVSCKKTGKPIYITVLAEENGETPNGTSIKCALVVLQELGVDGFGISGASCEIIKEISSDLAPLAKIPLIALPSDPENCEILLNEGIMILGAGNKENCDLIKSKIDYFDFNSIHVEKENIGLVFATENQIFFLEPETTEISPAINCTPDMSDILSDTCDDSYDVLCVEINSPDDAIDFSKNMHMATLPVMFSAYDSTLLKMALMLYQGRAMIDSKCTIEDEKMKRIAKKYGAVIY